MTEDEKPIIEVGAYEQQQAENVIVAPGQAALFPSGEQQYISWKAAEADPAHQAINVGPDAECSCGWKGEGWVQHYIAETRSVTPEG